MRYVIVGVCVRPVELSFSLSSACEHRRTRCGHGCHGGGQSGGHGADRPRHRRPRPAPDSLTWITRCATSHRSAVVGTTPSAPDADPVLGIVLAACHLSPLVYPGQCNTWNASVQTGVDGLHTALVNTPSTQRIRSSSSATPRVGPSSPTISATSPTTPSCWASLVDSDHRQRVQSGRRIVHPSRIPADDSDLDISLGPQTPADPGIPDNRRRLRYDPVMYAPNSGGIRWR